MKNEIRDEWSRPEFTYQQKPAEKSYSKKYDKIFKNGKSCVQCGSPAEIQIVGKWLCKNCVEE